MTAVRFAKTRARVFDKTVAHAIAMGAGIQAPIQCARCAKPAHAFVNGPPGGSWPLCSACLHHVEALARELIDGWTIEWPR